MDWTLLAYFVLAATATFVIRAAGFQAYSSVIIWVLYAGVACTSILIRKPFTLQYARETALPDRQGKPLFMRSNIVISSVWGVSFLANLVIVTLALDPRYNSLWIGVLSPILTLLATSVFTTQYVRFVRAGAGRS
jgi:hypothetical protein